MNDSQLPQLTMSAWLRFDAIRRFVRIASPRRVLEIGAGQGGLGAWLAQHYEYVGVEPDEAARTVATARIAATNRGRIEAALPTGDPYDVVCAFEVLEHVEDDAAALDEWREYLTENGHLVLSVPAHMTRFGPSDEFVGHYRRYERDALELLLRKTGFEVDRLVSYGAGLGDLLHTARNAVLRRRHAPSEHDVRTAGSGRLFQPRKSFAMYATYAVAAPFRILQKPFESTDVGIGYVVLAHRVSEAR